MKILNRTCDGLGPSGYDVVTLSTFVLLNEEKKQLWMKGRDHSVERLC